MGTLLPRQRGSSSRGLRVETFNPPFAFIDRSKIVSAPAKAPFNLRVDRAHPGPRCTASLQRESAEYVPVYFIGCGHRRAMLTRLERSCIQSR